MAAGVYRQTVTTTTGESVELAFWVDNTAAPTTWTPVSTLISTADTAITFNSNGQATAANSAPVVQASNTSFAFSASATFTPAATSHTGSGAATAGDCVGAAAEIDFNAPSGSRLMITSATLELDNTAAPATPFILALYNVTPPSALADDSPHTFDSGDRASFLGFVTVGTPVDYGNTCWVENHGINKQIKLAGDSVFAYLINTTTASLTASAHVVTLHAVAV